MERNSNLEHLWDMAMPRQNKRERALMYRSSTKPIPKAAGGSTGPSRDAGPIPAPIEHLQFSTHPVPSPIETFIPTADMSKYKTTSSVNNNQWTPQTRRSMYEYLNKAGRLGQDMTPEQWGTLKPEETAKYLDPSAGFDYTVGQSANPGGYKYWTRDTLPGRTGDSSIYYNAKKNTKYPTTYGVRFDGGLLKKKPLSRKEALAQDARDKGKTSLRKPNEVPGAASKSRSHRQ